MLGELLLFSASTAPPFGEFRDQSLGYAPLMNLCDIDTGQRLCIVCMAEKIDTDDVWSYLTLNTHC